MQILMSNILTNEWESLTSFLKALFSPFNPLLLIAVILVSAVILVNGWTDAPNAIATCVSTRAVSPKKAIIMAVICNFLGVLVMSLFAPAVMNTIYKMVDFGQNYHEAIVALCAGMFGIVIWAVAAWYFGIPTSESHALIAGITGAALAVGGASGVNGAEWTKVLIGILFSTIFGFGIAFLVTKLLRVIFKKVPYGKANRFFDKAQVFGGGLMAFMHGAQDGLKFIGVFMIAQKLATGTYATSATPEAAPIWLALICSILMGVGTSIGGYKIIKTVGMDMVKLEKYQGFASDISAAVCLLMGSLKLPVIGGLPMSTTHMKTSTILGVGTAKRPSSVNWSVMKDMVLTWVLTFPGCGLIGFGMAKLFMWLF